MSQYIQICNKILFAIYKELAINKMSQYKKLQFAKICNKQKIEI